MKNVKNKRILIIGGAGFIGSHMSDFLLKNGASEVVVLDNFFLGKEENLTVSRNGFEGHFFLYKQDATVYKDLLEVVEKHKPDLVLNFATKALLHSFKHPADAYKVNTDIALNILEMLRLELFERLVHISSSEVFGTAQFIPMKETHPRCPETSYAAGKAGADLAIESYVKMFGLDAVILRPFNNYGPRQNANSLAAVIPLTVKRIHEGLAPMIEGDGMQTRDFIYVEDTVEIITRFINSNKNERIDYNIGSGQETSIASIIKSLCKLMNYNGEISFLPERVADVRRHCADVSHAEALIGKLELTPLELGLTKTVNWYLEEFFVAEN